MTSSMHHARRHSATVLAIAATAALALSACSTDDSDDSSDTLTTTATEMTTTAVTPESSTAMSGAGGEASALIGAGCTDYAEENPTGPASLEELAMEPVGSAVANVPMLNMLTSALSGQLNPDVNLVDTLNMGEYTVFAPVDEAFDKLDQATLDALKGDDGLLTQLLTHHVVEGQLNPDEVEGEHTTLADDTVSVMGGGDDMTVDGASVVCGGIKTENATVYLIDTVLDPAVNDR